MKEIRFISREMIHYDKMQGDPTYRLELSPWDLQLLRVGPVQKGLLFVKPTPFQESELFKNNVVDHLKTAFARVLGFFYPLSGRLGVVKNDDDTSSFYIDCTNKGAYFIHAVVDNTTVKDILEPVYTPRIIQSFFPMNGSINIEGDSNPLLAVQVNELVDGYFIGCTMNHSVVDGSSFWHFLNSWSEISRGFETISRLPVYKRFFPSEINPPIRIPSSLCSYSDMGFILPPLDERVFHFPKEKIANLKARANIEMNTNNISSLQALLAHLWQSVIRGQKLDFDLEVKYLLLVGARPRLQSLFPINYFGNAVVGIHLTMKAGELLRQGVGEIASQMHQLIALQTSDELMSNYTNLAKSPKLVTMSDITKNIIITSSSPRYNVYGTDFGWGKPVAVKSGLANKGDGKITLFPGAEEGSIDVEVCLTPQKLKALSNDVEFMK